MKQGSGLGFGGGMAAAPSEATRASRMPPQGRQGGSGIRPVSRLLQDASLLHKKIDALVERDQNIEESGGRGRGADPKDSDPKSHFVDRLYESVAKLRQLEKSRNKIALCADSMESSVKNLNKFADDLLAEKENKERQQEERKRSAEAVIRTNGSLLQTEISLLLRSLDAEPKQIDQVKKSIKGFLRLVSATLEDL